MGSLVRDGLCACNDSGDVVAGGVELVVGGVPPRVVAVTAGGAEGAAVRCCGSACFKVGKVRVGRKVGAEMPGAGGVEGRECPNGKVVQRPWQQWCCCVGDRWNVIDGLDGVIGG